MEKSENEGKCVSCGFLALFVADNRSQTQYFEFNAGRRLSGRAEKVSPTAFQGDVDCIVSCYRTAANLYKECVDIGLKKPTEEFLKVLEVINKDRNCDRWYEYIPGFSPKEHLEMLKSAELEESRRTFELQLFESNRIQQQKSDKITFRFTVVLIIFAFLEVFGALYPIVSDRTGELISLLNENISHLSDMIQNIWGYTNPPPTRDL